MKKNKARILFWVFAIVVYLLLLVFSIRFDLDDNSIWLLATAVFLSVCFVSFGMNQIWYIKFVKQVKSISKILEEDKNPTKYIEENKTLLQGKKSIHIITMLQMNIAIAYCEMKDYQKAKDALLEIKEKKIHGIQKLGFKVLFILVYFHLEEYEEAICIMDKNRKEILKFADSNALGELISIILIFELIVLEEKEEAEKALSIAEEYWENERDFIHLRDLLKAEQ